MGCDFKRMSRSLFQDIRHFSLNSLVGSWVWRMFRRFAILSAPAPIGPATIRNIRQIQLPTSELCETCRTSWKTLRDIRLKSHPIRPNFETFACLSSPRPETSKHSSKKCAVRANYRDVRQKWIFEENCSKSVLAGLQAWKLSKSLRKIIEKSSKSSGCVTKVWHSPNHNTKPRTQRCHKSF